MANILKAFSFSSYRLFNVLSEPDFTATNTNHENSAEQ